MIDLKLNVKGLDRVVWFTMIILMGRRSDCRNEERGELRRCVEWETSKGVQFRSKEIKTDAE
jgi:hypothetical protein